MPKIKESNLSTDCLVEPLQVAVAGLRDRLGDKYRFKIENQTEQVLRGAITHTISMRNSGSRRAMINCDINSGQGGYVKCQWLRTLDVSIARTFQRIKTLREPKVLHPDHCNALQEHYLRPAVKSMLTEHDFVLISALLETNEAGGCRVKLELQRRDRSTGDGERIMCTTISIDYYSEGWL